MSILYLGANDEDLVGSRRLSAWEARIIRFATEFFYRKKTKKNVRFSFSTKRTFCYIQFFFKKRIFSFWHILFSFSTKKRKILFYSVFILFFGLGRYSSSRLSRLPYWARVLNNLIRPKHFRNKKCLTIRIMFLRKCS